MRVTNNLKDMYLSRDSLNVRYVNNFLLFEDFDSNLLPSSLMNGQFDLAKGTLTQCLFFINKEMYPQDIIRFFSVEFLLRSLLINKIIGQVTYIIVVEVIHILKIPCDPTVVIIEKVFSAIPTQ